MIDDYFQSGSWSGELQALRALVLKCGLEETVKWKTPCYTFEGRNVLMLGRLKNEATMSFFKDSLLKDTECLMERPGPNTRAARVIRFRKIEDITKREAILTRYIQAAIELEQAGQSATKKSPPLEIPTELQSKLDGSPELKEAFEALTPGRKRGYCLHIAGAKQAKTRILRIERCESRILEGKGLHDCTCGLSKKMPTCDGSHKHLNEKST